MSLLIFLFTFSYDAKPHDTKSNAADYTSRGTLMICLKLPHMDSRVLNTLEFNTIPVFLKTCSLLRDVAISDSLNQDTAELRKLRPALAYAGW